MFGQLVLEGDLLEEVQEPLQEEGVEVADQSQVVVVVEEEVPYLLEGEEEEVERALLVEGEEGEVVVVVDIQHLLVVTDLFECLQLQPGDEGEKISHIGMSLTLIQGLQTNLLPLSLLYPLQHQI